ncbi:unnamed protein product [Protopolystoma xenopodis]|uniref:NUC153 domain-containing protein n=1 Tax=Protopolystoma xenopodis TaxID=117903 RepID=A0A448XEA5_9PLAT|nr:unnamed protein product [Protopolystoma xenopodis]
MRDLQKVRLNGVKVYNLTPSYALPDWASRSEKRKRSKKASQCFELIQELEMPDSATYITASPDGHFLFVLGRYKPRVRCYELSNLSMKFDRCVDYLPYKIAVLSDDYSKFALLQEERWIDVHAAGGHFFKFRVPRPGVDIQYCSSNCNLLIAGSKNTIYRLNLFEGRFETSLESKFLLNSAHGFTKCVHSNYHDLTLAGSSLGRVDGWDLRTGETVFGLDLRTSSPRPDDIPYPSRAIPKVSALTYKDPLNISIGTSEGMVYIYDLRQNKHPWHTRDSEYRKPIKSIAFHEDKVLCTVANCVKIWNVSSGQIFVGFDAGPAELNHLYHFNSTGLIMLACETPKISSFFIPLLGHAPWWCSHIDRMVVECESDVTSMYDGYKFLTREQLSEHGMTDLIGSQFLRAYMHGYFVSTRLFNKIRERLNIISESKLADAASRKPRPVEVSSKPSVATEELEELAHDARFEKLMKNKKFAFDPANQANDLMKIHQKRLQKKRNRKEFRKVRAQKAEELLVNKLFFLFGFSISLTIVGFLHLPNACIVYCLGNMNRGRRRGGMGLSGLRDGVKRRLFDPNIVPHKPDARETIGRLAPIISAQLRPRSLLMGAKELAELEDELSLMSRKRDADDEAAVLHQTHLLHICPQQCNNIICFVNYSPQLKLHSLLEYAFEHAPHYHRAPARIEGIQIDHSQKDTSSSGRFRRMNSISAIHLLLMHEEIDLWAGGALLKGLRDPLEWYS